MTSTAGPTPSPRAVSLRGLCGGNVHLPGDAGYDAARAAWNAFVDQRPAAVAVPSSTAEVVEVVRAAAAAGLRVAPQGTGHNAGALGALDDVVLLSTAAMTGVTVDPATRRVRVGAGTLWEEAVDAAAAHGLAVLHGSSPDVGVVGYTLGGGIGWYSRSLGMAAHAVTGAEVVVGDGRVLDVDETHHPEVLWALRGGGGNVGVVTALEFAGFPFTHAHAGMLVWDWAHAAAVLPVWARWAADAPDTVTTAFRLLQLPPIPDIPEPFRGRQLVVIDGAVLADDADAEAVLAPLRALEPEMDTFARVPTPTLKRLHMDPEGPTPAVSRTATLAELPDEAVDALLAAGGPGSGSTLLIFELRQLGGALARPAAVPAVLSHLDGQFVLFAVTMALSPEMAAQGEADADRVVAAAAPWVGGRPYLNFAEQPTDASAAYRAEDCARLAAVRATVDPHGIVLGTHPVT